jgi:hypothetical protein
LLVKAIWGIALIRGKIGIMKIEGRAVRANNLIVAAHIEIDMRVIMRRLCAHAVEFPHADMNFLDADIIAEMWYSVPRHDRLSVVPVNCGDAAASGRDPQQLSDRKGLFNLE